MASRNVSFPVVSFSVVPASTRGEPSLTLRVGIALFSLYGVRIHSRDARTVTMRYGGRDPWDQAICWSYTNLTEPKPIHTIHRGNDDI